MSLDDEDIKVILVLAARMQMIMSIETFLLSFLTTSKANLQTSQKTEIYKYAPFKNKKNTFESMAKEFIQVSLVLLLSSILSLFVFGAGQLGVDEEEQDDEQQSPLVEQYILNQTCGFWNHCPHGYACFKFYQIGKRCAKPDPCSYFECPEQLICEEKHPIIPGPIPKVICRPLKSVCEGLFKAQCKDNPLCQWNRTGWYSGECVERPIVCGDDICDSGEETCNADCGCKTPWDALIPHNASITAYHSSLVPYAQQCQSEARTCTRGELSGSYEFESCTMQAPAACTLDGLTVPSGQSYTFYDVASSENCNARAQTRLCADGILDGNPNFKYAHCTQAQPQNMQPPTVSLTINGQQSISLSAGTMFTLAWSSSNANTCTMTNPQGGTAPVPPDTQGSAQSETPLAGQIYTYSLSCTNAAGTTTKTASVTGTAAGSGGSGTSNAGVCTYKGQNVPEGTTRSFVGQNGYIMCDNAAWVYIMSPSGSSPRGLVGQNVCDLSPAFPNDPEAVAHLDLGCVLGNRGTLARFGILPRHGGTSLTVTAHAEVHRGTLITCKAHTINWGDGKIENFPRTSECGAPGSGTVSHSHTYSSQGSYVVTYSIEPTPGGYPPDTDLTNSAKIRVD